jgi:ABC-2 type transport system ATP-binding protein
MQAIEASALEREFRRPFSKAAVKAVRGVDLSIEPGTVFGLLGPNGSGKTTTILMLLGLLRPSAGQVRVLGLPAGHTRARSRTGFLPEETRLYEFLTGAETLEFVGRLFSVPRAERRRRAEGLLRRTGMWEARDRRLSTYSKGMARRIGLAQALIGNPELVVLDEPTSGLDPVGNREVKDLLREVADTGTTILLTSHILSDVGDVCDEIAILHRGRCILSGDVKQLLADTEREVWETDRAGTDSRTRIEAALREEGLALHGTRPPETSMERLFLEALDRDKQDAGGDPS